ncbi:MAG: hypothetical protein Q8880_10655, partial [Bacteroidota bacterium]|nr:hypothetical protein [Bacteroidota bacterium]
MKIYTYSIFLLFLLISNLFLSCKKDQINKSTDIKLDFSTNNVQFDTVFTTIGSTTKRLLVYNNSSSKINISNISLVGGKNSNFRININGAPSNTATNIEVNPKDSLYIFVKVTVNPNNQNSPFVIRDSIMFNTNGNTQYVNLTAWGQNAYYHTPDHFSQDLPAYSIIKCNDIWKNDKPHVIYGWAVVDQGCKLSIQAGTKVHLFNNAVLWVYNGGSINVQGTANDPVIFQGTRLE